MNVIKGIAPPLLGATNFDQDPTRLRGALIVVSTAAVVLLCNAELNIAEVAEIFMRSKVMLSPSASELESSTAVPFKKQLLKATKQALAIEANADCSYFPGRTVHKVNVGVPTRQGVPTSGSI